MTKIDKTDIENIKLIIKETKIGNLSNFKIKKGDYEIEISSQLLNTPNIIPEVKSQSLKKNSEEVNKVEIINEDNIVKSPMVGTVYLAPSPDAKPFITEGQEVKEGDQLFIIEAMKTMNPVKSPFSGKVKKIIAKNEMPTEYDEVLAIIEVA